MEFDTLESINSVDGELTWLNLKNELTRLIQSKKVFYNYWDTCITYENSYFTRLNYIWYNPVKHGYVDSPEKWVITEIIQNPKYSDLLLFEI